MYGPKAAEFLELYPVANDAEVKAQANTVGLESGLSADPRKWAKAQAETGKAAAYLFLFSCISWLMTVWPRRQTVSCYGLRRG